MLSICKPALFAVPPSKPKNNSLVAPAQADTSNSQLDETLFVGMNFASSENKLLVPIPHTIESLLGSPDTMKSNAIAAAFVGIFTGTQTIGALVDVLPLAFTFNRLRVWACSCGLNG